MMAVKEQDMQGRKHQALIYKAPEGGVVRVQGALRGAFCVTEGLFHSSFSFNRLE